MDGIQQKSKSVTHRFHRASMNSGFHYVELPAQDQGAANDKTASLAFFHPLSFAKVVLPHFRTADREREIFAELRSLASPN